MFILGDLWFLGFEFGKDPIFKVGTAKYILAALIGVPFICGIAFLCAYYFKRHQIMSRSKREDRTSTIDENTIETMPCIVCGAAISNTADKCPHCGEQFTMLS